MRSKPGSFLGGAAAGGMVARFRLRHAPIKVVGGQLSLQPMKAECTHG
jgi:hypothetical protein